jgi:hypothetical protein
VFIKNVRLTAQTLFTVDVDRVTDFVFHGEHNLDVEMMLLTFPAFAVIDAPVEIAV